MSENYIYLPVRSPIMTVAIMKGELKQKKATSSQNHTDVTESEGDNWTFQFFQTKYILPLFMSCFLSYWIE